MVTPADSGPAEAAHSVTDDQDAHAMSAVDRLPPRAQVALVFAVSLLAVGWGVGMLVLQHRLVEMQQQARPLGAVASFFADGSSWNTAWPGWAAAFFFALSLLRLVRGSPEPPAGRARTVAGMRAALRREYRVVRIALAVVDIVAMFDLARALAYGVASATGDAVARADVLTVGLEAGGLLAAAAVLTAWMLRFRGQLESWGAL
jgi:hypothetical protein